MQAGTVKLSGDQRAEPQRYFRNEEHDFLDGKIL